MIDIVMTCYFPQDVPERQAYAVNSVESLAAHLCGADRLIIADDTGQGELAVKTIDTMKFWGNKWDIVHTQSFHRGIGASLNLALAVVEDLWLYTTDDWLLTSKLSLAGPARLLRENRYDVVRLGPIHPDLCCVTRFQAGLGWWLDIQQGYGGFAFATRPFIATKEFVQKIGPFDEGLNSYETERLYAERVAKSTSRLAYWGAVDLAGPWEHCGLVEVGYRDVEV